MSMHSPKHPIWAMLRSAMIMGSLVLILWLNAAEFDITELRTLLFMSFVAAGSETLIPLLRLFIGKPKDGDDE